MAVKERQSRRLRLQPKEMSLGGSGCPEEEEQANGEDREKNHRAPPVITNWKLVILL
jgi:hypothetical protein